MKRRLIVDMSSVCWTCLLVGKDVEFGKYVEFEGKPFLVNSAEYGYENLVNHLVSVMEKLSLVPSNLILVVEGMHSKLLRQSMYAGYKAGSSRPEEAYVEFDKLRTKIVAAFTALGASAVTQDGIEADDVIAYLAINLAGEKIIDSNDGDICWLISDEYGNITNNVSVWKQSKGLQINENPYGPFPCHHIDVYKALVGDTSDKLPGAKGFGDKAWLDLLCNFGNEGLDMLRTLLTEKRLGELQEDVAEFKPLQKILDNQDMVYASFNCARMYPMQINTQRKPLDWTVGMVKPLTAQTDKRLAQWAGRQRLIHAGNYDEAVKWMKTKLDESPFVSFDIETSSNDEADQWMETAKAKSSGDGDDISVDVRGAELCSFSLTFGSNGQYTLYFTVDHVEEDDVKNITKAQAKAVLEMIPKDMIKAIQSVAFEIPIVMTELGPLEEAA